MAPFSPLQEDGCGCDCDSDSDCSSRAVFRSRRGISCRVGPCRCRCNAKQASKAMLKQAGKKRTHTKTDTYLQEMHRQQEHVRRLPHARQRSSHARGGTPTYPALPSRTSSQRSAARRSPRWPDSLLQLLLLLLLRRHPASGEGRPRRVGQHSRRTRRRAGRPLRQSPRRTPARAPAEENALQPTPGPCQRNTQEQRDGMNGNEGEISQPGPPRVRLYPESRV